MLPPRSENATSTMSIALALLLRLRPGEQRPAPAFGCARIDLENGKASAAFADTQPQQRHPAGLVIHLDQLDLLAPERAGELVQTPGRVHAARSACYREVLWHPARDPQITALEECRLLPSGRCGITLLGGPVPLPE